jgi:transcription factor IIIB subunit 2
MTVDEFHTIDLDEEHDPPAFTRSRKLAKIKQIEEMANLQEIEKEIIQLQENIENSLAELQQKPRGILAKYAKLTQFEDEILGPNKDLTNIDTEIKEAEEFLSEEQINIIRSIVTDSEKLADLQTVSTSAINNWPGVENGVNSQWENLKPTLKSLGFVRESPKNNENKRYDEQSSSDEEDFDDEDGISDLSDFYDQEDEEDGNDYLDLESIKKRRRKYKKLKKLKKQRLMEENSHNEQQNEPKTTDLNVNNIIVENLNEKIVSNSENYFNINNNNNIEASISVEKPTTSSMTVNDKSNFLKFKLVLF